MCSLEDLCCHAQSGGAATDVTTHSWAGHDAGGCVVTFSGVLNTEQASIAVRTDISPAIQISGGQGCNPSALQPCVQNLGNTASSNIMMASLTKPCSDMDFIYPLPKVSKNLLFSREIKKQYVLFRLEADSQHRHVGVHEENIQFLRRLCSACAQEPSLGTGTSLIAQLYHHRGQVCRAKIREFVTMGHGVTASLHSLRHGIDRAQRRRRRPGRTAGTDSRTSIPRERPWRPAAGPRLEGRDIACCRQFPLNSHINDSEPVTPGFTVSAPGRDPVTRPPVCMAQIVCVCVCACACVCVRVCVINASAARVRAQHRRWSSEACVAPSGGREA